MPLKDVILRAWDDKLEEEAQEWLRKIPAISKLSEDEGKVSLDVIEKVCFKIYQVYKVQMVHIFCNYTQDERVKTYFSGTIRDETAKEYKWLGTVYGRSIYELWAKSLLLMFAKTRKMKKQ